MKITIYFSKAIMKAHIYTLAHHACPSIPACFGSFFGYFTDDAFITSSFIREGFDRNSCL